jgi:hemolysin III
MQAAVADVYSLDHYRTEKERAADWWIHLVAICAAAIGGAALLFVSASQNRPGLILAATLYSTALICMLAFSAVYNFSRVSPLRPFLRRLDEAGIFLMIAGSYTPFTTQTLHGLWAITMTSLVWTLAVAGIIGKLALPGISERAWTVLYVLFGWVAVLAFKPLIYGLPPAAGTLLVGGGVVYTTGSLVFLNARLPFRRAVWHGFVCLGAALHFAAITCGVVLRGIA